MSKDLHSDLKNFHSNQLQNHPSGKKVTFQRSHTPKPMKGKAMNIENLNSERCFSPQRGASISIEDDYKQALISNDLHKL